MALNKVNYVDGETVITAENMNDIQDAIIALENAQTGGAVSDDLKQALLQLAQKVAYIDDQGQSYYDDLYDALYPPRSLDSIDAVFNQGSAVIYDTASLNSLKQYLTVTANYSDGTREMLSDSAYTLSGTLTVGTSTVTASYQGKTDTFAVTVTEAPVLDSISAVYTQSGTVYDTDTLDSLKADLVVTAHYADSSTQTVPAADYVLSGALTVGTSTITVSYGGKTTTFSVTVTENPIPVGYTVYDYIYNKNTTSNDISVDTQLGGEYCGSQYEHELTFLVTNAASSTSYPLYGLRATTGSDPRARALWSKTTTEGNLACNYNGVDTGFVFNMATNTKYKCVTGNGQWKMNDVVIQDNMDGSSYNPPSTGTIRLFGIQTGPTVRAGFTRHNMRVYGFKVTNLTTNTVVAEFVPVMDSSETAGLYDIVNSRFCTAIVASTIGAGND